MYYQHKKISGFTLLELIVVMIIVGIITSLATLSVKNISRIDEIAAWISSLQNNLEYAKDMAILKRTSYGIQFGEKELKFKQNVGADWQPFTGLILSDMKYPEKSIFNLYIGGEKTIDEEATVSVIIDASSSITPFEFHLAKSDAVYVLKVEPGGEIIASKR